MVAALASMTQKLFSMSRSGLAASRLRQGRDCSYAVLTCTFIATNQLSAASTQPLTGRNRVCGRLVAILRCSQVSKMMLWMHAVKVNRRIIMSKPRMAVQYEKPTRGEQLCRQSAAQTSPYYRQITSQVTTVRGLVRSYSMRGCFE